MKKYFNTCSLALLILLFAYTSASKLLDYQKFIFQLRLAPIPLMKKAAPLIGIVLPVAEILVSVGLLLTRYQLKALYAAATLLIIFEIYIAVMLLSGLHLPCTCGGVISALSWKQHLLFNAAFLLITINAIFWENRNHHSTIE